MDLCVRIVPRACLYLGIVSLIVIKDQWYANNPMPFYALLALSLFGVDLVEIVLDKITKKKER